MCKCCRRKRSKLGLTAVANWARIVKKAKSLAYTRRKWAFLGHLLNQIKKAGKLVVSK